MRTQILATLAATVLAVGTLIALPDSVTGSVRVAAWVPACASEDSPGPCLWDARTRGNGQGRSFVVKTPDGGVTYLDRG